MPGPWPVRVPLLAELPVEVVASEQRMAEVLECSVVELLRKPGLLVLREPARPLEAGGELAALRLVAQPVSLQH